MKTPTKNMLNCPYCGGPPNTYTPISAQKGRVKILVECWSGNLHKESLHHLFIVSLKVSSFSRAVKEIEVNTNETQNTV